MVLACHESQPWQSSSAFNLGIGLKAVVALLPPCQNVGWLAIRHGHMVVEADAPATVAEAGALTGVVASTGAKGVAAHLSRNSAFKIPIAHAFSAASTPSKS